MKNLTQRLEAVAVAAICFTVWSRAGLGQTPPPVILEVDLENYVQYWDDVADPSKLASVPGLTTGAYRSFMQNAWVADIVAVNGMPARGTYVNRAQMFQFRPSIAAGQTIADINRNGGPSTEVFEFLQPDGTPIGTVIGIGLVAGAPPPGAPTAQTNSNKAIVGGTGAFLAVKGQFGTVVSENVRMASESEDPSLRRVLGGGKIRMVLHIIPAEWPEVLTVPTGPAIVHSADFTLVTPDKPARVGEILTLYASGLGPTRPGVDPGKPFPTTGLQVVNSPVQVVVNGTAAPAMWAGGYPGAVNAYQVNFRLPDSTASGMASLALNVAWISGSEVKIPVK